MLAVICTRFILKSLAQSYLYTQSLHFLFTFSLLHKITRIRLPASMPSLIKLQEISSSPSLWENTICFVSKIHHVKQSFSPKAATTSKFQQSYRSINQRFETVTTWQFGCANSLTTDFNFRGLIVFSLRNKQFAHRNKERTDCSHEQWKSVLQSFIADCTDSYVMRSRVLENPKF